MKREILFPTPMYWRDIPNAKELNKYLFNSLALGKSFQQTGVGNNISRFI